MGEYIYGVVDAVFCVVCFHVGFIRVKDGFWAYANGSRQTIVSFWPFLPSLAFPVVSFFSHCEYGPL